ncbi:MAG: hypothetical protein IKZ59_03965 [Clostridia bacterium]|nr:hypothetical protein [Clostridia bacterium]
MKRTFSILLALLLAFTVLAVPSFTASADGAPVFEISSVSVLPNSTFDVTVSIKNSPGIASAKIRLYYDSDLILNSVTYGPDFTDGCDVPAPLASPVIINWVSLSVFSGSAVFATLNFTAPDGIPTGEKYITLEFDPDDVCDIDENNVDFSVINGYVNVAACLHAHTEIRNARPISMTQPGYTGDLCCTDCDEVLEPGEEFFVLGDANIDGVLDVKDLVRLRKHFSDSTVEVSVFTDISGNGVILSNDFVYMRALILEKNYSVNEP